jgi:hypothetical protein
MYDPTDDPAQPPMIRRKTQHLRRGLPVPSVLSIVAIVSIVAGLAAGYRIAPHRAAPGPTPDISTPSIAIVATPIRPVQAASVPDDPVGSAEIPPPGGLSLSQALEAMGASFGQRSDVISARIGRYARVSMGWVWLIVVPYSALYCENMAPVRADASVNPAALGSCRSISSTELVILDYRTGEFLEDRIPAG